MIGDVLGSAGDSLEVVLTGEKAGLWIDRAEGSGGDVFDLIAAHHRLDARSEFARVLDEARRLLGRAPSQPLPRNKPQKRRRWNLSVQRPRNGSTATSPASCSPWCIATTRPAARSSSGRGMRCAASGHAPVPRPLYHQPGIATADTVVLVEGEKCAQALIDAGIVATTAMHGANAPVEKTDWSPLTGKALLIWPDSDAPGWEYAMAVAQAALAVGATACDVLLPPEDKPEGWDAADALAEGFDVAGFIASGPRMSIKPATATPTQEAVGVGDRRCARAVVHHPLRRGLALLRRLGQVAAVGRATLAGRRHARWSSTSSGRCVAKRR